MIFARHRDQWISEWSDAETHTTDPLVNKIFILSVPGVLVELRYRFCRNEPLSAVADTIIAWILLSTTIQYFAISTMETLNCEANLFQAIAYRFW